MKFINNKTLIELTPYPKLIKTLQTAFQENITVPLRHHHQYQNPKEGIESTLLLMPAWKSGEHLGIKIVTVSPNNSKYNLPSINGVYLLFNAQNGTQIAQMDAKTLTSRRTAAASALASSFLSRKDSRTLLMVGTGALAPCLMEAHSTVRPIETIFIWGRNFEKAKKIAADFQEKNESQKIIPIQTIKEGILKADIISSATLSENPLIFGNYLKAGQHIDLVGSFKPTMREADDETIKKSSVFVDIMEGATKESGDIFIPIQKGILTKKEIGGDLFDICRNSIFCRKTDSEITLFKSVGHALEDLAAARLVI